MAVEEAFNNLKGDLAIRAHAFIAFLAYCLHVTLARRLHALAPGLTPRSVLEKFAAMPRRSILVPCRGHLDSQVRKLCNYGC
jgi:hypothetical protein